MWKLIFIFFSWNCWIDSCLKLFVLVKNGFWVTLKNSIFLFRFLFLIFDFLFFSMNLLLFKIMKNNLWKGKQWKWIVIELYFSKKRKFFNFLFCWLFFYFKHRTPSKMPKSWIVHSTRQRNWTRLLQRQHQKLDHHR